MLPATAALKRCLLILGVAPALGLFNQPASAQLRAVCNAADRGEIDVSPMPIQTTGNQLFDFQLNQAFGFLANAFGVRADLKLYQEDGDPNALASEDAINPYFPDGTVYLGVDLLRQEFDRYVEESRRNPRPYTYTITAVLAHEAGHIAQMKYMTESQKDAITPRAAELGADYLAGWAFKQLQQQYPWIGSLGAVADGMRILLELGQDYQFADASHGSSRERVEAFRAGLRSPAIGGRRAVTRMLAYLEANVEQ